MLPDKLTDAERALIDTLPRPPALANVRTTNIWIIEWLSPEEKHTGRELHDWMEKWWPDWSIYCPCETKADVFAAIKRAQVHAQNGMVPVLHLESHGGDDGITPSRPPHNECITWEELTEPLQGLNLATRCNLVVVMAACRGYAAVQAFQRGPRAAAVALVGPDANVMSSKLLAGTKEFYRRWKADTDMLQEIAESASREMDDVHFEPEPFATLCYDALVGHLVTSARPLQRQQRREMLRQRLLAAAPELTGEEIENRLMIPAWPLLQQMWDEMFMIDLWPENRECFGLDVKAIMERIERFMATQP